MKNKTCQETSDVIKEKLLNSIYIQRGNMIASKERYIDVYKQGEVFLNGMAPAGIDLEKYYVGDHTNYKTLDDIFVRFIYSAQNYQRMPNVISFKTRKDDVKDILCGFDHKKVSMMNPEVLYKTFREAFNVKSADNSRNSWLKWSRAIVDSAKFLMEFENTEDFKVFVELFSYNVHTSMALPLLISQKINGIGFALACDLLKELGFVRYPKPDVHLIDVFSSLGLSDKDQVSTFEAIVRMATYNNVTPYKVDKIFFFFFSGKFYLEKPEEIFVRSRKKDFIELMQKNGV